MKEKEKNESNTRTWPVARSRRYFLFQGACFRAMFIGPVINTWKLLVRFFFLFFFSLFLTRIRRVNLFCKPGTVKFFLIVQTLQRERWKSEGAADTKIKTHTHDGYVRIDKSERKPSTIVKHWEVVRTRYSLWTQR